ncbi:heterogeneous nuclear ribonucleoprotein L-like [Dendronephthya gigantea]|uniref:heterogeneous nuclear ribonucleoprotein L-like n=1 Tax=Dendronephthya gigantea TaxID=151771 RepID=UPI001069C1B3|nr:heterogeneous nuclear ribonucleoprotein L-like [Dendronephthya gigantea]
MSNETDGQSSKRIKLEDGSSMPVTNPENPHYSPPSKVVHVRGVAEGARDMDIVQSLKEFGRITCIKLIQKKRQALVEFDDIESAKNLVEHSQTEKVSICGRFAFFNFSKSQEITRHGNEPNYDEMLNSAGNILLLTILNAQYGVTTSNLHEVFQGYGFIQRIVIFQKYGQLQAMVEFDNPTSAQQAKDALDGWDLYEGFNTLKIEYSNVPKLNVFKNDHETWDYTRPAMDQMRGPTGRGRGLLSRPSYNPPGMNPGPRGPGMISSPRPGFGQRSDFMHGPRGPMGSGPGPTVLMAYGFDPDKLSCEGIFNLLCPFGNVMKVKLMSSKPGCAMVEMGDHSSCNNIIENLTGCKVLDSELKFSFSKQTSLTCPANYNPSVETSFKDFYDSKLHRFTTAEAISKNRVFTPTRVLHFYNAPPDSTEGSLLEIFTDNDVTAPSKIKIFPNGAIDRIEKDGGMYVLP